MGISKTRPIIDSNGLMTQEMRTFVFSLPQTGNGVPIHDAPEGVLYTDLDASTGLRLYSSQGSGTWILT